MLAAECGVRDAIREDHPGAAGRKFRAGSVLIALLILLVELEPVVKVEHEQIVGRVAAQRQADFSQGLSGSIAKTEQRRDRLLRVTL